MPRSSCISHPDGERLILIRKWQLEACGKDACAAALLNLFEYWHNIKVEQSSQARSAPCKFIQINVIYVTH